MKHILFLIFTTLFTTQVFATKIGYINIDALLNESAQFKQSQQEIATEFKQKDKKIEQQAKKIEQLLAEFQEQQDDLTQAEKKEKIATIKKLDNNLKEVVAKTKQQFELRNAEELQKIQNNINTIIKQFATANDFDLILYKDIAFVSKKIDITDKISEKLNK
jgi:outer membrane protein